jgi:hypothetical protein
MVSPTRPTTKDLILHSNNEQSYIEVSSHHTLSDVRLLILDELDVEQLPDVQFSFRMDEIRISEKQEVKKRAFDLIERGVKLELVAKNKTNEKEEEVVGGAKRILEEKGELKESKRLKCDEEGGFVTPHVTRKGAVVVDLGGKFSEKKEEKDDANVGGGGAAAAAADDDDNEVAGASNEKVDDSDAKNSDAEEDVSFDAITSVDDEELTEDDNEKIDEFEDEAPTETPFGMEKEFSFDADTGVDSHQENKTAERNASNTMDIEVMERSSSNEVENDDELEVVAEHNPHKEADEAKDISKEVLSELKRILETNENFCTTIRKNELIGDIDEVAESSSPRTVFGVLGNTGV